jgi:hypothetical protein
MAFEMVIYSPLILDNDNYFDEKKAARRINLRNLG